MGSGAGHRRCRSVDAGLEQRVDVGADIAKLERDMASPEVKAGIQEVMQMADGLNLTGTPSWVVGRDVVVGAVGYDELKGKVGAVATNVAKCGKAVCS